MSKSSAALLKIKRGFASTVLKAFPAEAWATRKRKPLRVNHEKEAPTPKAAKPQSTGPWANVPSPRLNKLKASRATNSQHRIIFPERDESSIQTKEPVLPPSQRAPA